MFNLETEPSVISESIKESIKVSSMLSILLKSIIIDSSLLHALQTERARTSPSALPMRWYPSLLRYIIFNVIFFMHNDNT